MGPRPRDGGLYTEHLQDDSAEATIVTIVYNRNNYIASHQANRWHTKGTLLRPYPLLQGLRLDSSPQHNLIDYPS